MQTADIDLKKNAEIADWALDKEPGDRGCLFFSIKTLNDQTMQITFAEVGDDKEAEDEDEELPEGGNEGSDAAPVSRPLGSMDLLDDSQA